ncbi:ABC transporter permease [Pontibacter ruber]|uniref:ABC transporter permease n=1 Tax=Pontibacter ruber TaxID=1343895 RepID=A0ABW5CS44_9BACT|nr:ABC transporter permease [Pontibacter ruber]
MNRFLSDIVRIWQLRWAFRLALIYLFLFLLLVILLPWLPLSFQPNDLDLGQAFQPPFQWANVTSATPLHWLGTDALGRDVLSNTLFGARTAVLISLPVMLATTVIGLVLGTAAGFYADSSGKISRASFSGILLSVPVFLYFGMYVPSQAFLLKLPPAVLLLSMGIAILAPFILMKVLVPALKRATFFTKQVPFPADQVVLRLIEVFTSIPRLVIILVLASFMPPSVVLLSFILVLTYWTDTARLTRAETLRVKQLPYFEAAVSAGASTGGLLMRHALPNILAPVIVSFIFGLAGLLALESTLSFLGIGVPAELVSWGRTIAGIRANTSAWWLVVFPGGFLALTVLALQTCSYYILNAMQHHSP